MSIAPWYTWPTVGAAFQVIGALFAIWLTLHHARRVLAAQAGQKVREALERFYEAFSYACLQDPKRYDRRVGGPDGFCERMNNITAATDAMELVGNKKVRSCGARIASMCKVLYTETNDAIVNLQHNCPADIKEKSINAIANPNRLDGIKNEWMKLGKLLQLS